MKNNELKITIKGPVGIGKSTLLAYLYKKLFESDDSFVVREYESERQMNVKYKDELWKKSANEIFRDPKDFSKYELELKDWLKDKGITAVILNEKTVGE